MFAFAWLPQLPSITAEAQTYAERMFSWLEIGPLADEEARNALLLRRQGAGRVAGRPPPTQHDLGFGDGFRWHLPSVVPRAPASAFGRLYRGVGMPRGPM